MKTQPEVTSKKEKNIKSKTAAQKQSYCVCKSNHGKDRSLTNKKWIFRKSAFRTNAGVTNVVVDKRRSV